MLALHHPDSKACRENKALRGTKPRAQEQICSHTKFLLVTKEAWKIRVERREDGSGKLFFT